jgi:subtilase family serine protease
MLSRLISRLVLPLALFGAAFTPFSHAVVQNRIATVSGSSRVALQGNVSGRVKRSADLGTAPQDRKLESLSLRFSMTPAQQADLTQLLAAQLNSSSPSYRQWLTPEQFGARFGLSSADLTKVSTWLTSQGFTVTGTARSSTFITFTGTVAQAQQAFGTSIHSLSLNGEQHIANITEPVLPSAIAGVVTSITGLNDFKLKPRSRSRNAALGSTQPLNTQTINGQTMHFIAPGDFYTIYDLNPLITSGITGTGVTIAVMGQTDLTQGSVLPDANVAAFRTAAGLPAINLKLQLVGVDPGISTQDIDEAHIDVEWSGAAASGATILYVYGGDVFDDSLTYAVDNKVAPIITISYGACESDFGTTSTSGPASVVAYNQLLAMANAEGITVMSSSGDSGAADCDTSGIATEGLNVDFPSSSPFVTSAGGTMFSGDVSTPGTYWNSTNGTNAGSALSYIPETPWNETTATQGLDAGGAGGGGASAFFAKPSWQVGPGVPNDSARDVPDIALNAAANHDGYLVCSSGSSSTDLPCSNGFLSSSGEPNVFGGTSFVAPTFAGILALVEQKLGLGGTAATGLGNINPVLYGLANGATASTIFHDITSGNNAVPCYQGTPSCSTADPNYINGSIGFNAGTGYDQASGLGSVDVSKLANGWATAIPAGTGGSTNGNCPPNAPITGTSSCITATTLTTSGALCAITTGSLALSVTVAGAISGVVPTGTVQFLVDNKAIPGATANLVNGAATYTLVTTAAGGVSSGGHNISAVYSGDGNYAGSKGTLAAADGTLASVDIVSTTSPDFSITPCTGTTSVTPGGTAAGITFTITPVNGFTGTVNMTATNNNLANATTTFSVSPVTITSATGVTTSFVFKASTTTTTASLAKHGSSHRPSGRAPWYAAGSGATLACMLLLTLPRRRRWTALLAAVLSVAALTVVGCSNTSTTGGTTPTNPTNPTTPTAAGTYTYTITGVSGGLVHSTQVTVTVQ